MDVTPRDPVATPAEFALVLAALKPKDALPWRSLATQPRASRGSHPRLEPSRLEAGRRRARRRRGGAQAGRLLARGAARRAVARPAARGLDRARPPVHRARSARRGNTARPGCSRSATSRSAYTASGPKPLGLEPINTSRGTRRRRSSTTPASRQRSPRGSWAQDARVPARARVDHTAPLHAHAARRAGARAGPPRSLLLIERTAAGGDRVIRSPGHSRTGRSRPSKHAPRLKPGGAGPGSTDDPWMPRRRGCRPVAIARAKPQGGPLWCSADRRWTPPASARRRGDRWISGLGHSLRSGAARGWCPIRSSKPAGGCSPVVGRFDSCAAPLPGFGPAPSFAGTRPGSRECDAGSTRASGIDSVEGLRSPDVPRRGWSSLPRQGRRSRLTQPISASDRRRQVQSVRTSPKPSREAVPLDGRRALELALRGGRQGFLLVRRSFDGLRVAHFGFRACFAGARSRAIETISDPLGTLWARRGTPDRTSWMRCICGGGCLLRHGRRAALQRAVRPGWPTWFEARVPSPSVQPGRCGRKGDPRWAPRPCVLPAPRPAPHGRSGAMDRRA